MTNKELWTKINKENATLLFNLYIRWQDEKEHEDINDYLQMVQTKIPEAFKIYKRPFGIDCKCTDGTLNVSVKNKGSHLMLFGKSK